MGNKPAYIKDKPAYSIDSVDHALRLVHLLQQEESLRVTDAADHLGVSRSTAHRLLAMLVYHGFAEQADDRRYLAGPALQPAQATHAPVARLRSAAAPHLQNLTERIGESSNLMILVGAEARFLFTVESDQVLRVGDRAGRSLPAHLVSGGKVLLAGLTKQELVDLYARSATPVDITSLQRELALVRKRGFAINNQLTEVGVTAIGVLVRDETGRGCAAISVALPTARFDRNQLPKWVSALSACGALIEHDLESTSITASS